jgi:hypothetical protein
MELICRLAHSSFQKAAEQLNKASGRCMVVWPS